MANVGVYVALNRPAIVPDVLVTTHVEPLQDLMNKEHRAYFCWMFDGKVPDVVIEIVSNKKRGGNRTTSCATTSTWVSPGMPCSIQCTT